MWTSDHVAARWIAEDLAAYGLRHAVVAPGSRNAPLVLALHHHPAIEVVVAVDERAAGHIALGLALGTRCPAAVVTTSGTAAVNLGPALAEAFHQGTPLIALTADRPAAAIGKGHGQTVAQSGLFTPHVAFQGDLDETKQSATELREQLRKAWQAARTGPVHLNVPFEEPLYGLVEMVPAPPPPLTAPARMPAPRFEVPPGARVLLWLGPAPHVERRTVPRAWKERMVVLADAFSGWKGACASADWWWRHRGAWLPEVVVTVGGPPMSKALRNGLTAAGVRHVHLGDQAWDVFGTLEHLPTDEPAAVLDRWVAASTARPAGWAFAAPEPADTAFTDWEAWQAVAAAVPADAAVHVANSTGARYAQFVEWSARRVHANRGVAGIDGCTATAVGEALAHPDAPVVLVSGDLAFLYDLNGMWTDPAPRNLRVVVVDNGGGEIFRWLDGPERTGVLERYFEGGECRTRRAGGRRDLAHAARSVGADFRRADGVEAVVDGMRWLLGGEGVRVLALETDPEASHRMFQRLMAALPRTFEAK